MGLLEQEIYELRNLRKDFRAGKVDAQHVNTEIAIYSQTEKRAKLVLQSLMSGAKIKSGLMREIYKTNLIGDSQAIDTGTDVDEERTRCPLRDDLITRAECLDYSGSHGDDCRGCEIGRVTKARLLPPVA